MDVWTIQTVARICSRQSGSGPLCITGRRSQCLLWFPPEFPGTSGHRCAQLTLGRKEAVQHISLPVKLIPAVLYRRAVSVSYSVRPRSGHPSTWFSELIPLHRGLAPWEIPTGRTCSLKLQGKIRHPQTEILEAVGYMVLTFWSSC